MPLSRRQRGTISQYDPATDTERQIPADAVSEGRAYGLSRPTGEGGKMQLWDNVDNCWTEVPITLMQGFGSNWQTQLVIFKCTGCREHSVRKGLIQPHIRSVMERSQDHIGANPVTSVASDGTTPNYKCNACGYSSVRSMTVIRKHIEEYRRQHEIHRNAKEISMFKYSVSPPVTPIREITGEVHEASVNGDAPRPRRRRRRRNRSGSHGN